MLGWVLSVADVPSCTHRSAYACLADVWGGGPRYLRVPGDGSLVGGAHLALSARHA